MKYSDLIYFDQAATSFPKLPAVEGAWREALNAAGGNPGRSGHCLARRAAERVYDVREALCHFFDAPFPDGVVFTMGATHALNLALFSILDEPCHVLCSDLEHNAVLRPLLYLKSIGKITLDIFPSRGLSKDTLKALVRENTRLVVANHASNVCGRVLPIREIGAFCRERGILFVVDASQSAGHIPISMGKDYIDILCAPAHKGLYGIMGAGFAIFATKRKFPAFLHGGSGVNSLSPTMPEALPERYEAGSLPLPAILSLGASLSYIESVGVEAIMAHISRLEARLAEILSRARGVTLHEKDARGSGILSFTHERLSPAELAERLDEARVCVRSGYHCAPLAHKTIGTLKHGTVRLSVGLSNTLAECEAFEERLEKILQA